MLLTIQFGITGIGIRRVQIFGNKEKTVTFAKCLFCSVAIWRGKALSSLLYAVDKLDHSPEWIYENWPLVRRAARKGYAKGRAEGKASQWSWQQSYFEEYEKRAEMELENQRLRTTIETLRRMDSKEPTA